MSPKKLDCVDRGRRATSETDWGVMYLKTSSKRPGQKPKFNHAEIIRLLKAGEKPFKIMLLLGCSYGDLRYVRKKMGRKKV
jgi:hypothetical protein